MRYFNKITKQEINYLQAEKMRDNEKIVIKDGVCEKCGNPNLMYWCAECEASNETETCDLCGKDSAKIDLFYHNNCN